MISNYLYSSDAVTLRGRRAQNERERRDASDGVRWVISIPRLEPSEDWLVGRMAVGRKVARWQNLIASRPPPWRNPRKGRDRILQRGVAQPSSPEGPNSYKNLANVIWQPWPREGSGGDQAKTVINFLGWLK